MSGQRSFREFIDSQHSLDEQTKKGYRLVMARFEGVAGQPFETCYLDAGIAHNVLAVLGTELEDSTWNLWLQRYQRFAKWLSDPDDEECPKLWRKIKPKKIDWDKKLKDKYLSEEEFCRLLEVVSHPMDRAYFGVSYEGGLRPGEVLGMNIEDCKAAGYGFDVTVSGKTGTRTVPIVLFAPLLRHWLNFHPLKHNKNAPLWIIHVGATYRRVSYCVMNSWHLKHYCDAAKIYRWKTVKDKKTGQTRNINVVSLHYFRHSKVTALAKNQKVKVTTKQANMMFGWSPNSPMFNRYSHLFDSDSKNKFLELAGVEQHLEVQKPSLLLPKKCCCCNESNSVDALYCIKCGAILDERQARLQVEKEKLMQAMMDEIKLLRDKVNKL